MKKAMLSVMQEYLLPELEGIKSNQIRLDDGLAGVNKRLDDINMHLADQSRRIDESNQRIDEANQRMDTLGSELNQRIDETNQRIDTLGSELNQRIDETNRRIDDTNKQINETSVALGRLYEVIVRRDEHSAVVLKMQALEHDIQEIKLKLAA